MSKSRAIIIAVFISLFGLFTPLAATDSTYALNPYRGCGAGGSSKVCSGKNDDLMKNIEKIINALLLLTGSIAVIAIIISGIRFITADGDAQRVASARNGVIYSVVGLAVAIMAYAIVRFVVNMMS